jgi:hypothetical protein
VQLASGNEQPGANGSFFARQRSGFMFYFDVAALLPKMSRIYAKGPTIDLKEKAVNKGHLSSMESRHSELESKIETENCRPLPDNDLIHRLKKQKLHLKDAITQEKAYA